MLDVTEEMDSPTFKSDTVLSDVHLHCPNKRHLMVRLNAVGQPGNVCLDLMALYFKSIHILVMSEFSFE